jgi:uncharacterized membrane protein YoaK (UPF0700 family)
MGMIDPAVTSVGREPINLTFVTGTLNKIGIHLALGVRHQNLANAEGKWDTHFYRAALEAGLWVGFLMGAILSGAASSHFGVLDLVPASIALVVFGLVNRGKVLSPSTEAR